MIRFTAPKDRYSAESGDQLCVENKPYHHTYPYQIRDTKAVKRREEPCGCGNEEGMLVTLGE